MPLVPGEGNLLGHILHNAVLQGAGGLGHRLVSHLAVLVDHALKGHHRGADLFQLGEHPQLRHSDGALLLGGADIGAHIHGVVAGLQHPGVLVAGGAGVVIAGQVVSRGTSYPAPGIPRAGAAWSFHRRTAPGQLCPKRPGARRRTPAPLPCRRSCRCSSRWLSTRTVSPHSFTWTFSKAKVV